MKDFVSELIIVVVSIVALVALKPSAKAGLNKHKLEEFPLLLGFPHG